MSEDLAGFIEFKAWCSGAKFARISVTEIAEKIRSPGAALKEGLIHFSIVKALHGPAIQPKDTRSNDEISALQAAIAKCGRFGKGLVIGKPGACVCKRIKFRKLF